MRRCRGLPFAAIVALLPPGAHAGAKSRVKGEEAYRAAEAAWQRCFPASAPGPEFPDRPAPDDFGADVEVRRIPGGFRIAASDYGQGTEGIYSDLVIDFEPQGCHAIWAHTNGYDGGLGSRVEVEWTNRGPPTGAETRALVAEPARADDARHAFARSWLLHRCPGGPDSDLAWERDIEGPIAPAQPWHAGLPRRAPATFWPAATLSAIGAGEARYRFGEIPVEGEDDEDGPPPPRRAVDLDGAWIPPSGRPVPTFMAGRFQVFEAAIYGRNGGRAIALLDRAGNRHRWVVTTRGCVQGTTVSWIGTIGARIVGVTRSEHGRYAAGDAILIIDVPSATAWAIRFPQTIRDAPETTDRRPRASLSGSIVTLRVPGTTAKLDLAPLLALIPAR